MSGRLLLKGAPCGARPDQRRRLRRPPSDGRGGRLPLRRRRHACAEAPGARRGRRLGNRPRPPPHRGRAERAARRLGQSQRRLRDRRAARDEARRRDDRDHRPRARHGRHRAAAGRDPDLSADRHDHRHGGEARCECRRDHAHPGPRLLDVLVGERRERPLLLVLRCLRRDSPPTPSASPSASPTRARRTAATSARTSRSTGCIRARWTSNSAAAASTRSASLPRTRGRCTRASSSASPARAGSSSRSPTAGPTRSGRFTIVLPGSARGKTVRFWENQRQFFTRSVARPAGPVDLSTWPSGARHRSPRRPRVTDAAALTDAST